MNAIRMFSTQPWVGRLGWTLVHFLWQGLAIAAVYAGARASAKHGSPHRRYLLACAALTAMLLAPIITYTLPGSAEQAGSTPAHIGAAASNFGSGTTFPHTVDETNRFFLRAGGARAAISINALASIWAERILPSLVMLWFAGALIFCLRLTGGWMTAARLRRQRARTAPREWQQALDRLKARMRVGRQVRLLVSGLVEAPAVVGWLRPVILVPLGALAGLPTEHVEALLLHELAHIRRHDYLVNMLQSAAEALLFYHPAVWWISGHIRSERELCCDDLAVAATGDAFTYAAALTDLEACRPAHTQSAVAANGGRLADRIAWILGQTRPETRTFSAPGAVTAILLAIAACVVFGQSAERPKFEVSSVKEVRNEVRNSAGIPQLPGGRLRAENMPARGLIKSAYHLQDFQIVGGPNWLRDVGFDIEAKGDPKATGEQKMLMLQALLEDRFQLKYHRETRELPVYALTVAKSGSKLPAPKEGGCAKPDGTLPARSPGDSPPSPCGGLFMGPSRSGWVARGGDVTMPDFIQRLAFMLGRPVLDKTGIVTHFDVHLEFAIDDTVPGFSSDWGTVAGHGEGMADSRKVSSEPGAAPNILAAIQEQLGLKLEATKGPAEVMVIDHVEKPSGN